MGNKSLLVFGVARGGSSIAFEIVSVISKSIGHECIDLATMAYDQGFSLGDFESELIYSGHVYGMFREIPDWIIKKDLNKFIKILFIRDPRDCLVSHYFSQKNIHSTFVNKNSNPALFNLKDYYDDINEHCLMYSRYFRLRFEKYIQFVRNFNDIIVIKYEDIFYQPAQLVRYLCQLLGASHTTEIDHLLGSLSFKSDKEDVTKHNRQGIPGDYLNKLHPEIIDEISNQFDSVLNFFGYSTGTKPSFVTAFNSPSDMTNEIIQSQSRLIAGLSTENGYRIDEISKLKTQLIELEHKYGADHD